MSFSSSGLADDAIGSVFGQGLTSMLFQVRRGWQMILGRASGNMCTDYGAN